MGWGGLHMGARNRLAGWQVGWAAGIMSGNNGAAAAGAPAWQLPHGLPTAPAGPSWPVPQKARKVYLMLQKEADAEWRFLKG